MDFEVKRNVFFLMNFLWKLLSCLFMVVLVIVVGSESGVEERSEW